MKFEINESADRCKPLFDKLQRGVFSVSDVPVLKAILEVLNECDNSTFILTEKGIRYDVNRLKMAVGFRINRLENLMALEDLSCSLKSRLLNLKTA